MDRRNLNVRLNRVSRKTYTIFFCLYVGLAFLFSSYSPQAQIVSLWPPAGVALAGSILFSWRFLPAVFIGSVLFNSGNYFLQNDTLAIQVVVTSGVVAFGSVIQAWVNQQLLRYRRINILDAPAYIHVALFIGIALICCLISALIGNGALISGNNQAFDKAVFFNNVLIWWIGDFLGVVLVTPLLLGMFIRLPDKVERLRHLKFLLVPLIVIISALQVAQQYIEDSVVDSTKANFFLKAEAIENTLKQHMSNYLSALDHLAERLSEPERSAREEFTHLAKQVMADLPGIKAVSWNPLLGQDMVLAFERQVQQEQGAGFKVRGKPLSPRDPLVVVKYIEPLEQNRAALGFNVFSNEARKQSMLLAKSTRADTATNIIELVQSEKDEPGFLIFFPVFTQVDPADDSMAAYESLKGFAVGVFLVSEILNHTHINERLDFTELFIYENGNPEDMVYGNPDILGAMKTDEGLRHQFVMAFANHQWIFNLYLKHETMLAMQVGDTLSFLSAQMVFGTLAVFIILSAFGHNERLSRLVKDRTNELKRANTELERFAFYDALTGLPNRRLFLDRVEHALALCVRNKSSAGLLYMDLNGFKSVNDQLGHDVGDQLLIEVSGRFNRVLRDSDTLARLGGDEFTLILPDSPGVEDILTIVGKLKACLDKPIWLAGRELNISNSIGVAFYPQDGDNTTDLISAADAAMYAAKKSAETVCFYSDSLRTAMDQRSIIISD